MDARDREALAAAKRRLEHPSLAARLTSALGTPLEKGLQLLPAATRERVQRLAHASLEKALAVALRSLRRDGPARPREPSTGLHRVLAGASGAAGGALGLAALAVELPISTVILLRSIADVARAEGEELDALDAQLACLEVFALGGSSRADDATETGYFAVRAALARAVSEAASHAAERGLARGTAPALSRFVAQVAERFGLVVSEKAAAQLVPVLGALGGAAINLVFLEHFQEMARGHFVVRRLEREHGAAAVREAWERIAAEGG